MSGGFVCSIKALVSGSILGGQHHLPASPDMMPIPIESPPADEWMFLILVVGLLLVSSAWLFYPLKTKNMSYAALGIRSLVQLDKEGGFFSEMPAYISFVVYVLISSLAVFLALDHYSIPGELPWSRGWVYLMIVFFIVGFISLKLLMMHLLAYVFSTGDATRIYLENAFVVNFWTAILLMPMLFYQAYVPDSQSIVYVVIGFFILSLYKVVRGSIVGFKTAGFSAYYLFLYLCGVEIAPLLLGGKLFSQYLI